MQIAAFDTAKECQTERANHLPEGKVYVYRPDKVTFEPLLPAGFQPFDMDAGWYFARCVPADYVYRIYRPKESAPPKESVWSWWSSWSGK